MGQSFERKFRVRYHECDAYGHLNNASYVQYLVEAQHEGLAAAGFGSEQSAALGRVWQPRTTDIEYLRPMRYGETVRVMVRVTGLAGASLWRTCEFYGDGDSAPAARAQTETVLRAKRAKPAQAGGEALRIPEDMAAALCPEAGATPMAAAEFPSAPPPPPGVFKMRRRVLWQDLDLARQVGEARYLEYVEDASFGVIEAHGWPAARMVADGFAILLRRHQIEYVAPAQLDDELEIATWASAIRRVMATRHYTITRVADGAVLVRVHTLGVWVNLAAGRPIRIPADLLADFAPNLVYDVTGQS